MQVMLDTTRPKSSLTVENVQRFEARSAKGGSKKKRGGGKLKRMVQEDGRAETDIQLPGEYSQGGGQSSQI